MIIGNSSLVSSLQFTLFNSSRLFDALMWKMLSVVVSLCCVMLCHTNCGFPKNILFYTVGVGYCKDQECWPIITENHVHSVTLCYVCLNILSINICEFCVDVYEIK